ncbi:MAG: asparaginase [Bacteroidales bacterium]|nr:asparaginase [Bacteroidales bacterium]MDY6406437.1 asparaginase [Bacteroidales bacterium]
MSKVLLISTGGTITMVRDKASGALVPADMETFKAYMPELFLAGEIQVDIEAFTPQIDSSDIGPQIWEQVARMVVSHYDEYDGFVVLHGTDTMSYSASALSFMLENLSKPVVFTGSQLPVGVLRSDAKENLLTAIEIAAAKDEDGNAIVPEVTIYFEDRLFRANRTTKRNAEHFSAFNSYNYPALAKAGVHITYQPHLVHYCDLSQPLRLHTKFDTNVAVLKLFPGIQPAVVRAVLRTRGLKGVVLETFGAGNAPSDKWLYRELKAAVEKGIIIVNKTQCNTGSVEMGLYAVSLNLMKAGVLSGYDITTEALLTKMMLLLGENPDDTAIVRRLLGEDLCGEITIDK